MKSGEGGNHGTAGAVRWILLHGFAGAPSSWYETLAALAPRLEPIAPRLCGHGTTAAGRPMSARCRGFEGEVARIAELVAAKPRGPAEVRVLVGYSLGGRLAVGLLLARPELFDAAVLVSAHPGLAREEERAERRASDEQWATLLERDGVAAFAAAWERQPVFAGQERLGPAALECQRRTRRRHHPSALATAMRALSLGAMPSYGPRLQGVTLPVRWVVGERDAKFRMLAEVAAAKMPRSRVEVLAGCGHNPLLEVPNELARVLRRAADEAVAASFDASRAATLHRFTPDPPPRPGSA